MTFELNKLPPSTYTKTLERVGTFGRGASTPAFINFTTEAKNFIYAMQKVIFSKHNFKYVDAFFAFKVNVILQCESRAQFNREIIAETFNQIIENSLGTKANQIFELNIKKEMGEKDATIMEIIITNRKGESLNENNPIKQRRANTTF